MKSGLKVSGAFTDATLISTADEDGQAYNVKFQCIRRFVESQTFAAMVVMLICLNALFIAATTQWSVMRAYSSLQQDREAPPNIPPAWERGVSLAFSAFFTAELLLRMLSLRCEFFVGPEWKWNLFDLILAVCSLLDVLFAAAGINLSFIRTFRLVRMLRSVRIIRVLRFFRQLRLLLLSVLHSIMPLMWSVVFLLLILFVFVVISLQAAEDYFAVANEGDVQAVEDIHKYFGTLSKAWLTHYMAVSGGVSWVEQFDMLCRAHIAYGCAFVLYVLVMMLVVLNIVTGIFVSDAIEMAQNDRDLSAQTELEKNRIRFQDLHWLFKSLDTDQSGRLTLQELEVCTLMPDVTALFDALALDVSDATRFFKLLDVDGSGELEIDEFVMGCMNLKGHGKTVSMETFLNENKKMMKKWASTTDALNLHIKAVEDQVSRLADTDAHVQEMEAEVAKVVTILSSMASSKHCQV